MYPLHIYCQIALLDLPVQGEESTLPFSCDGPHLAARDHPAGRKAQETTREGSVHVSSLLLFLTCHKHGIQPTHTAQQADCSNTPRFQLWAWILTANGLLQRQKSSLLRVVCGCGLTCSRASTKTPPNGFLNHKRYKRLYLKHTGHSNIQFRPPRHAGHSGI